MNATVFRITLCCTALCSFLVSSARADIVFTDYNGVFTVLTPPGSIGSGSGGVNDSGTVVGSFYDASATAHGFLFSNGVFTQFDIPGHTGTSLTGISNAGSIVGFYSDVGGGASFMYDGGSTTTIDYPNSSITGTSDINSSNTIVGYYYDNPFTPATHGFVYSQGTYSPLDIPGALFTQPNGINDAGIIVGTYEDASMKQHGFIDNNGTFTTFDIPGATFTVLEDIDNNGDLAGYAVNGTGAFGFVASGSTINIINYPSPSSNTFVRGVNDSGVIVGDASTGNTAVPEPSTCTLLGIGGLALAISKFRRCRKPPATQSTVDATVHQNEQDAI